MSEPVSSRWQSVSVDFPPLFGLIYTKVIGINHCLIDVLLLRTLSKSWLWNWSVSQPYAQPAAGQHAEQQDTVQEVIEGNGLSD